MLVWIGADDEGLPFELRILADLQRGIEGVHVYMEQDPGSWSRGHRGPHLRTTAKRLRPDPPERTASEAEETPSGVVQVSEEERGEDRREHDDREGNEHGRLNRTGHLLLLHPTLRLEDVHVPDDPGVVVQGEGTVQAARYGEREEPTVEGCGVHRT